MADENHEHDHDHAHDPAEAPAHGPAAGDPPRRDRDDHDPASASLADAMRVSFGLLKLIMIVLIVAFLGSGVFEVKEGQQVAVRVHLGQIHGEPGGQVLGPGWHFAWPQPIDHVLLVPIKTQTLPIVDSFWFAERPGEQTKPLDQKSPQQTLAPGTDGSLITGDRNIIHVRYTVSYQVLASDEQDVLRFVRNVSADSDPGDMLDAAQRVVRLASERGMVRLAAEFDADRLIAGLDDDLKPLALQYIQQYLDDIESGITVTTVLIKDVTPPLSVRSAFNAVTTNENERATLIDNAKKERSTTLIGAAGAAYPAVLLAINAFEAARLTDDAARIERTEAVIDALLDGQPAREALKPLADEPAIDKADLRDAMVDAMVGGEVRTIIADAMGYQTAIVQDTQGEVARFVGSLEQYQQNPRLVLSKLWEDARSDILSSPGIETFYLPQDKAKNLYIELNRDPEIQRKRESDRYRQQQQP